MLAIVRVALGKPYTFVVMAMLIVIFGVTAAIKTPTDIFPNIGIPVVAVVWTYDGLPADDMSKRVIYYYERTLSSQVNDIEHIESQSLPRYGIVKVFFQPGVNINGALAQTTAASQTVLKYLPPGITPPFVLSFNASSVPVIQLALSSKTLSQAQLFDLGQNFIRPQLSSVAGTAIPRPIAARFCRFKSISISKSCKPTGYPHKTSSTRSASRTLSPQSARRRSATSNTWCRSMVRQPGSPNSTMRPFASSTGLRFSSATSPTPILALRRRSTWFALTAPAQH